jgi:hypothetical protein
MPVKPADSQLALEVLSTVVVHMHWHEEEKALIQLLISAGHVLVCMYKGWAMKSGPCTATFNDLVHVLTLLHSFTTRLGLATGTYYLCI